MFGFDGKFVSLPIQTVIAYNKLGCIRRYLKISTLYFKVVPKKASPSVASTIQSGLLVQTTSSLERRGVDILATNDQPSIDNQCVGCIL